MATKYCTTCDTFKDESEFYKGVLRRCKECCRAAQRKYYSNPANVEKHRASTRQSAQRPIAKFTAHERHMNLKRRVMDAYGGCCACCGERTLEFLTIDHINNDGAEHRKKIGMSRGAGGHFYKWLEQNHFPDGMQVLCYNCNCGKDARGICPHKGGQRDAHN